MSCSSPLREIAGRNVGLRAPGWRSGAGPRVRFDEGVGLTVICRQFTKWTTAASAGMCPTCPIWAGDRGGCSGVEHRTDLSFLHSGGWQAVGEAASGLKKRLAQSR
jgi:hypothetical protein